MTMNSQPTQFQMAIQLGLDLITLTASEWEGINGQGHHVTMTKYYWLRNNYFHSGPFISSEHALTFICAYYQRHPEEVLPPERVYIHLEK